MATGPVLPTDPVDILTPDLSRPEPYINKYWGAGITGITVGALSLFTNYVLRKPILSELHKQAAYVAAAAIIGQYCDNKRRDYLAERDAVLRHYVHLHPEDFPPIERKKFSEILLPWAPIR